MNALKIITSILGWIPVAMIKVVIIIIGFVVVPLMHPNQPAMWRADTRIRGKENDTIWEAGFRNPAEGFAYLLNPISEGYLEYGMHEPEPTTHDKRFAWRFRIKGVLSSLRIVFRYTQDYYGEIYIGWKIDSEPGKMDFGLSPRVIPRKVGT